MTNQYKPDYSVPPGEHITEYMGILSMGKSELAHALGISKKKMKKILKGKARITKTIATKLEDIFAPPAHLWLNLEKQYQKDIKRLGKKKQHCPKIIIDTSQSILLYWVHQMRKSTKGE